MRFLLSLLTILLLACQPSPHSTEAPFQFPEVEKPARQLNVGILIMDGVYNTELTAPMDIFQHTIFHDEQGMQVFTVSQNDDTVRTFEGLHILPDYQFERDSLPQIDVLVVPSAEHHLDSDLKNTDMIQWVRETGQKARYVMSLCDGAFVLAKAGLLDSVASTTFPGDLQTYQKMFPHLDVHTDVYVVHDGKFITSAGGARSFEPALYLAEMLYGKKAAYGIARGMVIDWEVQNVRKFVGSSVR